MKRDIVYFITDGEFVKIGWTNRPARARLNDFQVGNVRRLRLLGTVYGNKSDEKFLHSRFSGSRVRGEWFEQSPELTREIELAAADPNGFWEHVGRVPLNGAVPPNGEQDERDEREKAARVARAKEDAIVSLRETRSALGWSRIKMARELRVPVNTVQRWETTMTPDFFVVEAAAWNNPVLESAWAATFWRRTDERLASYRTKGGN